MTVELTQEINKQIKIVDETALRHLHFLRQRLEEICANTKKIVYIDYKADFVLYTMTIQLTQGIYKQINSR